LLIDENKSNVTKIAAPVMEPLVFYYFSRSATGFKVTAKPTDRVIFVRSHHKQKRVWRNANLWFLPSANKIWGGPTASRSSNTAATRALNQIATSHETVEAS
jgi:hypothetical protein